MIIKTTKLVAWKRVYVEQDRMYRTGATLTADFVPDANTANDVIVVDNSGDFMPGTTIEFFDKNGVVVPNQVISKTATTLTVNDMNTGFVEFSGVRVIGISATYDVPTHLFTRGYGEDGRGTDGGAFVEYKWGYSDSESVPKYTVFPNDGEVTSSSYCLHWRDNPKGDNVFQLVAIKKHPFAFGYKVMNENTIFVAIENFNFTNNNDAMSETAVHEFGHIFGVSNSHVDASQGVMNHDNSDKCNMSYDRVRDNGIVEFDTDCIYDVRDGSARL